MKDGKAHFYSRSGKELKLPNLEKEAASLFPKGEFAFAGELYVHHDTQRSRSFDTSEAIANPDKCDLRFMAFDVILLNDETPPTPKELYEKLDAYFKNGVKLSSVKNEIVQSRKTIVELFETWVEKEGHEGLVIRSFEGLVYKAKPRHTIDAVILAYFEGIGEKAGTIRSVLLGLMHPDGSYQIIGDVGNGFTDSDRVHYLEKLRLLETDSEYIEVGERQMPFRFVKPEIVVQFSVIDLMTESKGAQVMKMNLTYDPKKGYQILGQKPSVNLIMTVFQGERTDKQVNEVDIRFAQVTDLVELDKGSAEGKGDSSEILRREVYVKETKGMKAVRKVVAWKTNKEKTGKFPPFLIMFTDFSANRAEKLDQELHAAASEAEMEKIFDQLLTENIKKGWVKV
jgi:hypothetical protein